MLKDDFPKIWVPTWENRDLRQLLWHRHRMVQAHEGLRCKKRLWREHGRQQLQAFRLVPWASQRRRDLLELMDRLNPTIAELTQATKCEVEKCPEARRLMDASRSRCLNRTGLRVDRRPSRTLCFREASGELSGTGAVGRLKWQPTTPGAHHQTGEFDDAFFAGGSGAGDGAQPS
jgi:hypothetical protein